MEKLIFSSLGDTLKQEDRNKIGDKYEEFLFKEKKEGVFLHTRLIVNRKTKEPLYMFNIIECQGYFFKSKRKKYGNEYEDVIFNYLKNHNSSMKSKNNIVDDNAIEINEKDPSMITYRDKYKKDDVQFNVTLVCKLEDEELKIKDYSFVPVTIGRIQDIPSITQQDIINAAEKLYEQIEANEKVKKLENMEYVITYNYEKQIIAKVKALLDKERF